MLCGKHFFYIHSVTSHQMKAALEESKVLMGSIIKLQNALKKKKTFRIERQSCLVKFSKYMTIIWELYISRLYNILVSKLFNAVNKIFNYYSSYHNRYIGWNLKSANNLHVFNFFRLHKLTLLSHIDKHHMTCAIHMESNQ